MILLEVMRGATAHTGVEPCVGPKTVVMSFPRVMIISLLALAKYAGGFAAMEGVDVNEVGQTGTCHTSHSLHSNGSANADDEGLFPGWRNQSLS